MENITLINKKIVKHNSNLKKVQKQERKRIGKGNRKVLKNYIGKVVALTSDVLVGEEYGEMIKKNKLTKEEVLSAIKEAKLTGMSGNGRLVVTKMQTFLESKKTRKTMIINAVECDPTLVHDAWLLQNRFSEIVQATKYLKQAFSIDAIFLTTTSKDSKTDAIFKTVVVPARYPMGKEQYVIKQVLGIPMKTKEMPAKQGILVLNLQTVYQIGKILNGNYDGGRFITVADMTKGLARVAYVQKTDTVKDILKASFKDTTEKMYIGQGGLSLQEASLTDTFNNYATFVAYGEATSITNTNACKRCGTCTRKCPEHIKVAKIVQMTDNNKVKDIERYHPEQCIGCHSCTYFCPASKEVSSYVKKYQ